MTDSEMDALVAEKVFGYTGIGYYGPPESGDWTHLRSRWFATKAEADAAYASYHDEKHGTHIRGIVDRDDWDSNLCYWKDGWGPRRVGEYSSYIADAWEVKAKIKERLFSVRLAFILHLAASLPKSDRDDWKVSPDWMIFYIEPRDICLAALKAVGVEVDSEDR